MKWEVDILNNTVKGNGWEFEVTHLDDGTIDCNSTVIPDDADIDNVLQIVKSAGDAYMSELKNQTRN